MRICWRTASREAPAIDLPHPIQKERERKGKDNSGILFGEPETPSMIRLLLKTGVVKTELQAVVVLLVIVVLFLGIAIWLIAGRNAGNDVVITPDGTVYTAEEYFELVRQGKDPLR